MRTNRIDTWTCPTCGYKQDYSGEGHVCNNDSNSLQPETNESNKIQTYEREAGDPNPAPPAERPSISHPVSYRQLPDGSTSMDLAASQTVKVTPTANATYTTSVPAAGTFCSIIILTSGTTSRTITFGTGFKPTTTLATGTVTARIFVLKWISDGTNLYEVSRTAAMTA